MKRIPFFLFLFLSMSMSTPVLAQQSELKVADGSSSGTYKAMFGVMKQLCGDTVTLTEVDSHGALENLAKLVENEANAGFMHADVIAWRGMSEPQLKTSLKALLVLWPEDIHFIVKAQPFMISLGTFGFNKNVRTLATLTDLDGMKVGAAGGGYVTAQRIRYVGEVKYEVVPQYDTGKEVLEALNKGEIAAAVFVGAAPLPNLKDLGRDYRILSIGEGIRDRLTKVGYHTSNVAYAKMSAGGTTTVSTDALLVAQQYKSQKWLSALSAFRGCFYAHLDEIRETPGMHKAWQKVEPDKVSEWPMYERLDTGALGTAATPVQVQVAPPAPSAAQAAPIKARRPKKAE